MSRTRIVQSIFSIILLLAVQSQAAATPSQSSLCLLLEAAARESSLPVPFLTRVIWRESRFNPDATGPPTRSGAHAEGIAQFMPETAAQRAVTDPFDPIQALPKAAQYLHQLRDEFGNLGLAAAAYNAGPARVNGWLNGARTLPNETRRYVQAITGRNIDDWVHADNVTMAVPKTGCIELLASLEQTPSRFIYDLERQVTVAINKPWGVELAAGFSRARVLATYSRLTRKLSELIEAPDPIITATTLRSRGIRPFFQARIGTETRGAANAICRKIQRAGAACLVLRNSKS